MELAGIVIPDLETVEEWSIMTSEWPIGDLDPNTEKTILLPLHRPLACDFIIEEVTNWIERISLTSSGNIRTLAIGDDNDSFILTLYFLDAYNPVTKRKQPSIKLFMINVPEEFGRKGIFTAIRKKLEEISKRNNLMIIVGPFFNDWLPDVLQKHGYVARHPLDMYLRQ